MMRLAGACARGVRGAATSLLVHAPRRDTTSLAFDGMPILEKGCYCYDLANCVKIQGFVFTVMSLLLAVADLALLALAVAPREQDPGPHVDEYGRRFISTAKVICMGVFVGLILWALICSLMLYGIYKRRPMLFLPYMVTASIIVLVTLGLLVFYASSVQALIYVVAILVVLLAVQLYLLLHVVSLFQKMRIDDLAELVELGEAQAAGAGPLQ